MDTRKVIGTIIGIIFFSMFIIGLTMAIYTWRSGEEDNVKVGFTVDDLGGSIVYYNGDGEDDVSRKVIAGELNESNNFTNSTTIAFYKSVDDDIYGHLYLNVTSIDDKLAREQALKWAIYEGDTMEGEPINEGNFNGEAIGNKIPLDINIPLNKEVTKYTICISLNTDEVKDISIISSKIVTEIMAEASASAGDEDNGLYNSLYINSVSSSGYDIKAVARDFRYDIIDYAVTDNEEEPLEWESFSELNSMQTIEKTVSGEGLHYIWVRNENNDVYNKKINIVEENDISNDSDIVISVGKMDNIYFNKDSDITIPIIINSINGIDDDILNGDDILVKVGNSVIDNKVLKYDRNNEYYVLSLSGINEEGELKIEIPGGVVTDKVGNINNEASFNIGIVDNTKPVCTFGDVSDSIKKNVDFNIDLICTDSGSGLVWSGLDKDRLTTKDNDIKIVNVGMPVAVVGGYKYLVTLRNNINNDSNFDLTLKSDSIWDKSGNYVDEFNVTISSNATTIMLDNNGATSSGTKAIYGKYDEGIYLDNDLSKLMSNDSNSIDIPEKKYIISYDMNGTDIVQVPQEEVSSTFNGYYDGDVQMISNTGFITDNFTSNKYKGIKTLTANWTNGTATLGNLSKEDNYCLWNTEADGKGDSYVSGQAEFMLDKNQTLYARCMTVSVVKPNNCSDSADVSISSVGSATGVKFQYSKDNISWTDYNGKDSVTFDSNGILYLKILYNDEIVMTKTYQITCFGTFSIENLFNDNSTIKKVHIGGDEANPEVELNENQKIMKDNNGDYRYYGADPHNWVSFNGEKWRIISYSKVYSSESDKTGSMRLKLIRPTAIGDYSYDGGSGYSNDWSKSDLANELNTYYYNGSSDGTCYNGSGDSETIKCDFSGIGLKQSGRDLIDDALYYLGGSSTNSLYSYQFYNYERESSVYNNQSTQWSGKVGIMYPSDYTYAADLNLCKLSGSSYSDSSCANNNWLYLGDYEWTISPYLSDAYNVFFVYSSGFVNLNKGSNDSVYYARGVRPVVYLKSDVSIVLGDGTEESPYQLVKPRNIDDLYNDGSKSKVHIGGDNSNPEVELNETQHIMKDNNGDYRYYGADPHNWVSFNGEKWRIISYSSVCSSETDKVCPMRLKLIRPTSIGSYSYDSSASGVNSGYGVNDWSESDLANELNTYYLNSTSGTCYNGQSNASTTCNFGSTGLKDVGRNLIDNALYYLGGSSAYSGLYADDYYNFERGNTVPSGNATKWVGKVGVMYPSDYVYAADLSVCKKDAYNYNEDTTNCMGTDWLFLGATEWTISSASNSAYDVFYVYSAGYVINGTASSAFGVRPVVYLKSGVSIGLGEGTEETPYELVIS